MACEYCQNIEEDNNQEISCFPMVYIKRKADQCYELRVELSFMNQCSKAGMEVGIGISHCPICGEKLGDE